jgi:hypothetical protein
MKNINTDYKTNINNANNENNYDNKLNCGINNKNVYHFLLLGQDESEDLFMIKAQESKEENEQTKNEDEENENSKYKTQLCYIKKQDINKYLQSLDGIIIFSDNNIREQRLTDIIEYVKNISKNITNLFPRKYFPKIILGNKSKYIEAFGKGNLKEGENICKNLDIIFAEYSTKRSIGISFGIDLLLKRINISKKYDNYIYENRINEKQVVNVLGKTEVNLLKCLKCREILEMSIDKYSNSIQLICKNCNLENKYNFFDYEKLKKENNIKCNDCKKQKIKKNMANYCTKCKNCICNDCSKKHFQRESKNLNFDNKKNIIYPYNLVNFYCNIHERICYNYCLDCKTNICPKCEIDSHINHKTKIYDEKKIHGLINIQKQNLELEKEEYCEMKEILEDCLKSLKKYFTDLITFKQKEINIKEEIINELEIFKYDHTLLKNVQNLNFENYGINYNYEDSWEIKLNNLFDFFKEPMIIKKINFCKKENLSGPYNFFNQVNLNNSISKRDSINEYLTDICSLKNYNNNYYFAVSFNNGLLKIYNDDFNNRIPIMIIKEFESNEGINSISKISENTLLLIGNSIIKKINISEDFKEYKVINKIEISEQFFKTALELDSFNAIITINNYNQLFIYDSINGKQLLDVENEEEILFIDQITENKIIFQYGLISALDLINIDLGRTTIRDTLPPVNNIDDDFFLDIHQMSNSICISSNKDDMDNKAWKIFEFDNPDNILKIKKKFFIEKGDNYLGKIDSRFLLLFNNSKNQIILFDYISYSRFLKLSFNYSMNPIASFPLKKRVDFFDLLILCDGGYFAQFIIDLKKGFICLISKINIYEENLALNSKINNNSLLDLRQTNVSEKQNTKKDHKMKNDIIKIVNLAKTNFLIVTKSNYLYNLKNP